MKRPAADDLEDDYVREDIEADDEEEGLIEPGNESIDDEPSTKAVATADELKALQKRKRREKDKERKAKKRKLTQGDASNVAFTTCQSPSHLSDFLFRCQKASMPSLTQVELDDFRIPESCIADTTELSSERKHENLEDFIRKVVPKLATRISQKPKHNGAPTVFIISGNALRATDLARAIRPLKGERGGEITKLFAKHYKMDEHVAHLKKTKVGVAVGTPARIGKLLSETGLTLSTIHNRINLANAYRANKDALSLQALTHIILDVTFIDTKQRSMMDLKEVRDELFKTVLGDKGVRERLRNSKIELVLF